MDLSTLVTKDVLTPVLVFVSTVIGAWLLRRTERQKLIQSAQTEVRAAYSSVIDELQQQMVESRIDRRAMREELADVRLELRDVKRRETRVTQQLAELIEYVRVVRSVLRAQQVEAEAVPAPPPWFADPLTDSWPPRSPATG